ncbi:unnamed protein product [Mytilus coruscus]|uniref:BEN domain-containing protein n=1 Tax=Mytilus coruscus TaxID=42192 RepID=A0A6J8C9E0_MYTCO|nr:unnamed protein product [Mytilus coruscus]
MHKRLASQQDQILARQHRPTIPAAVVDDQQVPAIPDLYNLPNEELTRIKISAKSAGNFAAALTKRFFPELYGMDNLRYFYNWNGGGKHGKRELDPARREIIRQFTVRMYPEVRQEDIFRTNVINAVNEMLRRQPKKQRPALAAVQIENNPPTRARVRRPLRCIQFTQRLQTLHVHDVNLDSEVPDHCGRFGLSSEENSFCSKCDHTHHLSCNDCEALTTTLKLIEDAADSITYTNQEQQDDTKYIIVQGKRKVLDTLQPNEALIERDWAMKFLPLQYRETQSNWFAKRGLFWHVSVITFQEKEGKNSLTVVHVFDTATQDAVTSNAILKDLLHHVNSTNNNVDTLYLRSDNAGCYHSSYGILSVTALNDNPFNITVNRMDFSDPQGGKSICDRKAAHVKACIRRYVNEGNNVITAIEFKSAVEKTMKNVKVVVALPPSPIKSSKTSKIENISFMYNFFFSNNEITAWKQFEIGIGKVFSSKSLNEIPSLVKKCESTVVWRTIVQSSMNTSIPVPVTRNEELEEEDNICSNVFTCPENGCIATFLKYGQLCNHLDRGKHTYPHNNLNIKERTQIRHASLMESKSSAEKVLHSSTTHALQAESTLKKGWALKNKREVKRFSKEQIEYMTEKFQFGESTGYKCDPDEVAKEMRHVKNSKGIRKFQLEHFLSPSQIASFFSRLSLKKRQASNTVYDDCDMIAEESKTEMSQLTVLANTVQ